ncbi:hypothetical protein GCM10025734_67190 [Kitasatospora paranensis]|uniref:ABC transporter substrate-binding protein n=1 Tax=Kitasatospora paranensis TaxID=258053 RepID=UPI0031E6F008
MGWDGTLYQSTEVYRFFKERLGARSAAVVSYDQADSARYARQIADGLRAEGYRVLTQTVDLAVPGFQAVAAAMKADGSELLFDAMDTRGNAALCQALDAAGVKLKAKVTNVQNWTATVGTDYRASPAAGTRCGPPRRAATTRTSATRPCRPSATRWPGTTPSDRGCSPPGSWRGGPAPSG